MKIDRKFKILSLLATVEAGISFADLCAKLGFTTEKERNATSVTISALGGKGWVNKPAERGGNWSITPDGRGWLTADQKFARKAARKSGPAAPADDALGDFPTQRRVPAVDGQAPRNLVNSPFSMAAATSKGPPPGKARKAPGARSGKPGGPVRREAAMPELKTQPAKVSERQVGGDHYRLQPVQPWDYIAANGIGFFEGNVIKYVSRWQHKGGVEDLHKARHYLDKLIELQKAVTP